VKTYCQTELIPAGRLLEEHLGKEFFDLIPKEPGIYRFYDRFDELLYVGKAADLHCRLASYRRARAGKVPRKVGELVSRVHRIETEVYASPDEALFAENRWIRSERPPYNHANKHTETYYFIIIERESDSLSLRLTMRLPPAGKGVLSFGCFKGHIRVRRMLGCLLQVWWLTLNQPNSPHYLPVQLTRRITPMFYRLRFIRDSGFAPDTQDDGSEAGDMITNSIALKGNEISTDEVNEICMDAGQGTTICSSDAADSLPEPGITLPPGEMLLLIRNWFEGRSDALLHFFAQRNREFAGISSFNQLYLDAAMDQVTSFYTNILLPHRQMREIWLNGDPLIDRDRLDDLLVMLAASDRRPVAAI
jgi:hypothetical protein